MEGAQDLVPDERHYLSIHRRRLVLSLGALADLPRGRHVDVGSFTLHVAMVMAALGHHSVAADLPYMQMVPESAGEFNRRLIAAGVEFSPMNPHYIGALNLPDASFDSMSCFETMEHMAMNHYRLVAEWRRVLRPGARLAVSVPNVMRVTRFMSVLLGRGFPPTLDEMKAAPFDSVLHFREYRKWELRKLLTESGFTITRIETIHTLPLASQGAHAGILKRAAQPLARLWPFGGDTILAVAVKPA